jgi:hypothetical protein
LAQSNESDRKSTAWLTTNRPLPELANALRSQANQIGEAWIGAIRAAIPAATGLPSQELEEHLPAIIAKMADAMDRMTRYDADELMQPSPAREPGPFQHRYDVRAMMTEDRLLRRVILERAKVALGRPLIPTERAALDNGIDAMLQEAVAAQHRWAQHPMVPSKHQAVVVPAPTPVAQTRSPSSGFGPVIGTDSPPARFRGGHSSSPERPAAINTPTTPDSLSRKAPVPVFVVLPPQPQALPVAPAPMAATQGVTSSAAESIRAPLHSSAGTACEAAIAPGNAAATAPREFKSPQAAAALNAIAADVTENPVLHAATVFPEISVQITHEWVAVAAYYIWENNGKQEGRALQDWLQAQARLRKKDAASR